MASRVRTSEELKKVEFNYFEAFQIPLNETNADAIQKKINSLLNSKSNSSDPVDRCLSIDLKEDVKAIMIDDAVYDERTGTYQSGRGGRKKEADNYKRLKMENAVRFASTLCARGVVYKSEIKAIAEKNKVEMSELEAQLGSVLKKIKYVDDTQNRFDVASYESVDKYLKGLGDNSIRNLCDLLEITPKMSWADIKQAFADHKQRDYAKSQKKNNEGIALKNLYGEAEKIFCKEEAKSKAYFRYLAIKDNVYMPLKSRKENGITVLRSEEYLSYIASIQSAVNCSMEEADQDLAALLKAFGLKLEGDANIGGDVKIEICPYPECKKPFIADANAKVCPHCGKPLEMPCWNCQGKIKYTSSGAMTCPQCGASEKTKATFLTMTAQTDALLRNPHTSVLQLKTALNSLKAIAPGNDKNPNSEIAKKVAFYAAEIAKREKAEEGMLKQFSEKIKEIDKQIALKNFQKADALLKQLERELPGYNTSELDNYKKKIAAVLSKAAELLAAAKRYKAAGNESAAIESAANALEFCADNVEAQQILRSSPPKRPSALRSREGDDGKVTLEWDPVGDQKQVTYTLVRKLGAVPKNTDDGTVIAHDLTLTFYEDRGLAPATDYYYGVFAERCGVRSELLASPRKICLFFDVRACRQETSEGKISVKWEVPENVKEIVVRKRRGAVALSRGEGELFNGATKDGFVDEAVDEAGVSYFVTCVYDTEAGKKESNGVQLYYKPFYIPKKIGDASLDALSDGSFEYYGREVTQKTQFYFAKSKVPLPLNKVEAIDVLTREASKMQRLNSFDTGRGCCSVSLEKGKTGYLYAINANDRLFICAAPIFVTTLSGVSNVTHTSDNGMLRISFQLDSAVSEVLVKMDGTRFPESLKDNGYKYSYSADKIKKENGIHLKLNADSISYVTLFPKVSGAAQGEEAFCPPVKLSAPIDYRKKQMVKYCMQYAPSAERSTNLTISFDAECELVIPKLMVMKGNPRPLNKQSGEMVARTEEVTLKKGLFTQGRYRAKVTVKLPPMAKAMKVALFFAEDDVKNLQLKEVMSL